MAINENLDVRQGDTQSLGPMQEGAHSSFYLIIIASFSEVWSLQLLKAMQA